MSMERESLSEDTIDRLHHKTDDMVGSVGFRHSLPPHVFVLARDEITLQTLVRVFQITYRDNDHTALHRKPLIGLETGDTPNVVAIAGHFAKTFPDVSFICEQEFADALQQRGNTFVDLNDGHYKIEGFEGGVLEVFVPYQMRDARPDEIPRRSPGGRIYKE